MQFMVMGLLRQEIVTLPGQLDSFVVWLNGADIKAFLGNAVLWDVQILLAEVNTLGTAEQGLISAVSLHCHESVRTAKWC